MTPEQKEYYDKELASIRRGGSQHYASMQDRIWGMGSPNLGPVNPPVVAFGQDDDPWYTQYFQNWAEVNAMINQLREEAKKAWGEDKTIEPAAWMNKHGACISTVFKEVDASAGEYTVPLYRRPEKNT